jgi:hypothetical protein
MIVSDSRAHALAVALARLADDVIAARAGDDGDHVVVALRGHSREVKLPLADAEEFVLLARARAALRD